MPPLVAVLLAYVLAGLIVALGARISLAGSPALGASLEAMGLGRSVTPRALLLGVIAGGAAAAVGAGWLAVVNVVPALRAVKDGTTVLGGAAGDAWWAVLALGVLAAPLFEEYLFRGLLLGGMLRSVSGRIAVPASALVFAVVHPPISFPPVLALGLAAGFVFLRTRVLWASVAAHAVYNGIVLFLAR